MNVELRRRGGNGERKGGGDGEAVSAGPSKEIDIGDPLAVNPDLELAPIVRFGELGPLVVARDEDEVVLAWGADLRHGDLPMEELTHTGAV